MLFILELLICIFDNRRVSDRRRKRWLVLGDTVARSVSAIEVEFDDDIKGLYTIRGSSTIVPVSER